MDTHTNEPRGTRWERLDRIPNAFDYESRRLGLLGHQIGPEFDRFQDYWTAVPGQKGRKLDWLATWRNWIRRAVEQQGRQPGFVKAAAHREIPAPPMPKRTESGRQKAREALSMLKGRRQ